VFDRLDKVPDAAPDKSWAVADSLYWGSLKGGEAK
jgi:hypothetical protein